jgi:hypothetical protein
MQYLCAQNPSRDCTARSARAESGARNTLLPIPQQHEDGMTFSQSLIEYSVPGYTIGAAFRFWVVERISYGLVAKHALGGGIEFMCYYGVYAVDMLDILDIFSAEI